MKNGLKGVLAGVFGTLMTFATAHAQEAKDAKDPAADVKVADTFPGRLEQYYNLVETADALRPSPSEEWLTKGRFAAEKVEKALAKDLSKLKGKVLYEKLLAIQRGEVRGIRDEAQWGALCYLASLEEPASLPYAVKGLIEDDGLTLSASKAVAIRIKGEPLKTVVLLFDGSAETATVAEFVISDLPTRERIKEAAAHETELKTADGKARLNHALGSAMRLIVRKERADKR